MSAPQVRVLLIEDSPSDARLIKLSLLEDRSHAFEVTREESLDDAIVRLQTERFDVILLDLGLPDSTGIDTLVRTSAAAPQLPIVVLTGSEDHEISLEAIRRGSQDYLIKGHVDGNVVANAIRHSIERKQAAEELKALNEQLEYRVAERTAVAERRTEQLRRLAAELTLAEQRERGRLAQVLHDGLQQTLVAAKFSLSLIGQGGDVQQETKAVADLIDEAIETSRSLTAELSPPMFRHGGLIVSLKWLAQWFGERHGLKVELKAREDMNGVPEEVIILLFQSVRELLFNVVKHSGIKAARVDVTERNNWITVSIKDEGKGFDPRQLRAEGGSSSGFGLFSISERLSFLGGQMEIHSAPGKGSRFDLVIPYSSPK